MYNTGEGDSGSGQRQDPQGVTEQAEASVAIPVSSKTVEGSSQQLGKTRQMMQ